jgi:general secretion pathway protein M
MNRIQEYWQQLTTRERILLLVGGGLLLVVLIYSMLIEPLASSRAELQELVERSRTTHSAIQQAVAEARMLRSGGAKPRQALGTQSMMGRVDESARRFGLGAQMKRVEPSGKDNISVWLEKASFDSLAAWLEEIERQYGLQVHTLEAERVDTGLVNARVILGP